MFKNLSLYRLATDWDAPLATLEDALQAQRFVPCGASQERSMGWVAPRGEEHAPLVEAVGGQRILKWQVESKSVPSSVVQKKAQEAADQIEASTGRKPGKKEIKTLREEALAALLPQAFAKQSAIWVWIDPKAGWLVSDASSQARSDDLVTALVGALPGLSMALLQTQVTPQAAMTEWLLAERPEQWPSGFSVERECELKSSDEEKSVVRYTRHHLLNDEVRQHIQQGKLPTRLAMSWEGRVGFVLGESMQLKKIAFLEGVFDERAKDDSGFDADVALSTGELQQLLPALIEALGGELNWGSGPDGQPVNTAASTTAAPAAATPVAAGTGATNATSRLNDPSDPPF